MKKIKIILAFTVFCSGLIIAGCKKSETTAVAPDPITKLITLTRAQFGWDPFCGCTSLEANSSVAEITTTSITKGVAVYVQHGSNWDIIPYTGNNEKWQAVLSEGHIKVTYQNVDGSAITSFSDHAFKLVINQ